MPFLPTFPGQPPMGREPNEQMAAFFAFGGLPLIDAIVLLGTGLFRDSGVSLMWFPVLFALLAAMMCRRLAVNVGWGLLYTLGCGATCWITAVSIGLFDSLFLPW